MDAHKYRLNSSINRGSSNVVPFLSSARFHRQCIHPICCPFNGLHAVIGGVAVIRPVPILALSPWQCAGQTLDSQCSKSNPLHISTQIHSQDSHRSVRAKIISIWSLFPVELRYYPFVHRLGDIAAGLRGDEIDFALTQCISRISDDGVIRS